MHSLPDFAQAYQRLSSMGEQFPEGHRDIRFLSDITYQHPRHGSLPIMVDAFALSGVGRIYAEPALHPALAKYGTPTDLSRLLGLVSNAYYAGQIWGFSGFATPTRKLHPGADYKIEAAALRELFAYLRRLMPILAVDGAVSDGVLGLIGILARHFGMESLGFSPNEGLASIGPRDHLVVCMDTYQQRERLVATVPDVLWCSGGADATLRECLEALRLGSIVVLMALRGLSPLFEDNAVIQKARNDHQLLVCKKPQKVLDAAQWACVSAVDFSKPKRSNRFALLHRLITV